MKHLLPGLLFVLSGLALSPPLAAQVEAQDESPNSPPAPPAPGPGALAPTSDAEKIKALEESVGLLMAEREAQARRDEELLVAFKPSFKVFGFTDLSMQKYSPAKGDVFALVTADKLSFSIVNTNLYFLSRMTEELSALAEIRFSFFPQGQEKVALQVERTDTSYRNPITGGTSRLGGLAIERVVVRYEPLPWLSVLAGRFLTPAGIWNIDHGSTVVIPVRLPPLISLEMFPLSQTGLVLEGRHSLATAWMLGWMLTVSNGRSPTEAVKDLDENKALGGKLSIAYDRGPLSLSLGSYCYFGKYTNDSRTAVPDLETHVFHSDIEVTEQYEELISVSSLLAKFHGLRLQAEYAYRLVDHSTHPLVELKDAQTLFYRTGTTRDSTLYVPNFFQQALFLLLAYELPRYARLPNVRVTPYVFMNVFEDADYTPINSFKSVLGGVNLGLTASMVLKLEGGILRLHKAIADNDVEIFSAQLATSF